MFLFSNSLTVKTLHTQGASFRHQTSVFSSTIGAQLTIATRVGVWIVWKATSGRLPHFAVVFRQSLSSLSNGCPYTHVIQISWKSTRLHNTVDGKNPTPIRMPENVFSSLKKSWCRIFSINSSLVGGLYVGTTCKCMSYCIGFVLFARQCGFYISFVFKAWCLTICLSKYILGWYLDI